MCLIAVCGVLTVLGVGGMISQAEWRATTSKTGRSVLELEIMRLRSQLELQARHNRLLVAQVTALASNLTHATSRQTGTRPYYQTHVVFGHMHVPKTGGTTLNGNLSVLYERVCGTRGNSYDALQVNERFRHRSGEVNLHLNDTISRLFPNFNRVRVPLKVREEIGFEDCDWISQGLTRTVENPKVTPKPCKP
jgi:hypothetical protein